MGKLLRFLYGYVILCIEGEQLGRFLNLCRNRGIFMEKISYINEGRIQTCVSVRDYFKLRPVRNKTGVHIKILKKGGLPVWWNMEYSDQWKYKKQYSGNTEISGKGRNRPWDVQKEGKMYTACCLCAKRLSGYYLGICQDHRL